MIHHNALTLVTRLQKRGISVTGVTKAILGAPEIVQVWLQAGVSGLGDSRIENMQRNQSARTTTTTTTLIRAPMLSQVNQVVALTDISLNTEISTIRSLSVAAKKSDCLHGVVLMVELGDLREGIMPALLEQEVKNVLNLPNISFMGIGTNLACRSGVNPDTMKMNELSTLANSIDSTFGSIMSTVSGGNSANLHWALSDANTGRINNLRLGEAMLLGREALHRTVIDNLHTSAITLIAEVIELKQKPSLPWGNIAQTAFGETITFKDQGIITQAILAIGRQDTDPDGLTPPEGISIIGSSSDHLVIDVSHYKGKMEVGTEVTFQLNYSALLRTMTSPFVPKFMERNKTTVN